MGFLKNEDCLELVADACKAHELAELITRNRLTAAVAIGISNGIFEAVAVSNTHHINAYENIFCKQVLDT